MENNKNDLIEIFKEKKSLFVGVLILWLISLACTLLLKFCCGKAMGDLGAVGDTFGAVNALFSGLAFAGMVVTLVMQKQELELQREELKETRKEMRSQTEQFELQSRVLKIQLFENTYYTMLNQHERIVDDLILKDKKGKEAVSLLLLNYLNVRQNNQSRETYFVKYKTFYPYLNHLIQIFKYVDDSPYLNVYEKYDYLQKFVSTFWKDEIHLLSIYGLNNDRLKSMIEKYGLLESININNLYLDVRDSYDIEKATKFNKSLIDFQLNNFEVYSYCEGFYTYKIECRIESKCVCFIDHIKLKNKESFMVVDQKERKLESAFRNLRFDIKGIKYWDLYNKLRRLEKDADKIDDFQLSRNIEFTFLGGIQTPYNSDHSHDILPHDNWTIEISVNKQLYEFPLFINEIVEKEEIGLDIENNGYPPLYF